MRPVSSQWEDTIRTSHQMASRIEAYYGGELQGTVPIIDGTVIFDAFAQGARRCTLTVPLSDSGTDYNPRNNRRALLAANGQQLKIHAGVIHPDGTEELVSLGWFVITDWHVDEVAGTVSVTGSDKWTLLERAPVMHNTVAMRIPESFSQILTMHHIIDALMYPRLFAEPFPDTPSWPTESKIMEALKEPSLPNRLVGIWNAVQFSAGESRTAHLQRIAEAWPAILRVHDQGYLRISAVPEPPQPGTAPDVYLSDISGTNPILTARNYRADRDKIFNSVNLTAIDIRGERIAQVNWQYNGGDFSTQGPFGYAPRFAETTLASSKAEADEMAQAMLRRSITYAQAETVHVVPDPAIELDDIAEVTTTAGGTFTGLVVGIQLPLTETGAAEVTVSTYIEGAALQTESA